MALGDSFHCLVAFIRVLAYAMLLQAELIMLLHPGTHHVQSSFSIALSNRELNFREVQGCLKWCNYRTLLYSRCSGKSMFKELWEISHIMSYKGVWEIFLEEKTKMILGWRDDVSLFKNICCSCTGPKFSSVPGTYAWLLISACNSGFRDSNDFFCLPWWLDPYNIHPYRHSHRNKSK